MNLNLLRQCRKHLECVSSEWSFCAGTVLGVFCAPLALLFGVLLPPGRAFWLAIGTCGVLLMQLFPAAFVPPHFEQIMAGRSARIDYEIRLDDLRITGVDSLELPKALRAQLTKIRFDGETRYYPCRGEIILFPDMPPPRCYGSIITGKGTLQAPREDDVYTSWLLVSENSSPAGRRKTWRSAVLKIRDSLLERLCSSIADDNVRHLAAAFFLGTTGGMTQERRHDFAAAGTIHLFAVSGLHVGMAAMLFLVILRLLPFRIRCFTAAALVWGYVLLTGAAVPAVRAGVMISLFLICRGMLFAVSSLRIMGAAAGIIIISDPEAVKSIGFHYSFLITAVLLLLAERMNTLRELQGRIFEIMPFSPATAGERRCFRWRFTLQALVISGISATLAGSVISLCHAMALTPGAVIANWFTLPVLGILFAMLPVKLLASCAGGVWDRTAAGIIEMFFDYLKAVAEIMSSFAAPFYAIPPGKWLTVVMIVLLLAALSCRRKAAAVVCGIVFLLLLAAFPLVSWFGKSAVTVISSDTGTPPTVVICDKALREISIINPVRAHRKELEKAVKSSGIPLIAEIGFSKASVRNLSDLKYLCSRYMIEKVLLPRGARRNGHFTDSITEYGGNYRCTAEGAGGEKMKILRKKDGFAIEYPDSGVMLGWRLEISHCDRGRVLNFSGTEGKVSALLPWSSKNGIWQYEL